MNRIFAFVFYLSVVPALLAADPVAVDVRPAKAPEELTYWLTNMLAHQCSTEEIGSVLTLSTLQTKTLVDRIQQSAVSDLLKPVESQALVVLPYPGGRHPRIGFLDGAIQPQRETKVSVFAPWKEGGYLVVDVPEAVWHLRNGKRELLYLAHTHVPTIWDQQGLRLERLEWKRDEPGKLSVIRKLPNLVTLSTKVKSVKAGVRMEFSITNRTSEKLTGLDIQMCGMLKGLTGFAEQTNDNKIFVAPFAACKNHDGSRWVILGFDHCVRAWGNPPCPCLHADPKVPDCEPGETQTVRGWVSFFEGIEINDELKRLEKVAFEPITE